MRRFFGRLRTRIRAIVRPEPYRIRSGAHVTPTEVSPLTPDEQAIVDAFHKLYYEQRVDGRQTVLLSWFGHRILKCPFDIWTYQELIWETKPDLDRRVRHALRRRRAVSRLAPRPARRAGRGPHDRHHGDEEPADPPADHVRPRLDARRRHRRRVRAAAARQADDGDPRLRPLRDAGRRGARDLPGIRLEGLLPGSSTTRTWAATRSCRSTGRARPRRSTPGCRRSRRSRSTRPGSGSCSSLNPARVPEAGQLACRNCAGVSMKNSVKSVQRPSASNASR